METKSILVQYKGGGYSGCVWEWNFFVFDGEGRFFDIFSSGVSGVTTESEARELLGQSDLNKKGVYVCSIPDGWEEFQGEINAGHVVGIAKKTELLREDGVDLPELRVICDSCGARALGSDSVPAGEEGAGGLAVQFSRKLCVDCFSAEEYASEEEYG